ncbi:MAG TPA: cation:proton antiporter [Solirubrobacteraceae bacterium]|nr:cation:proton antiporter [Solirubrobacteraceae bacterium]
MSLGVLTVIGLCGLAGPLLSVAGRDYVPVVVGEILAGALIGRNGLDAIDPANPTLAFLGEIGFGMLMFSAGLNVPLREPQLRSALGTGATAAALVTALAAGAGAAISEIDAVGHPAVYAVLIASGSAAIVLPVLEERRLSGRAVLTVMAQVTVADIAATLAVPLVLRPAHAGAAIAGSVIVALSVLALLGASHILRGRAWLHELRRLGKRRRWALDLRVALIVLFGLGWLAQRTGASLLIAGFGTGLMVALIGGPKRLSTEVLGIAGGFFIPLFFVVLGAGLDLGGLFEDPAMLGLAAALAALNVAAHLLGASATRQQGAAGLVASAQMGVPAALIALGVPAHVITPKQATAIIAAALISILACSAGAGRLRTRVGETAETAEAAEIRMEPRRSP